MAAAMAIFVAMLASSSSAAALKYPFMKQAHDAPTTSYYDYIIVGGGTSGCPLAATLSEKADVLLLERGDEPYGKRNVMSRQHFADSLSDTSPSSPSQRFVSEDGVINARARVLGGGSCLNAGFYTRASPRYVRSAGWDGVLVNASYEWVEREVVFEPAVPRWQRALREGLVEAGVTPDNGFSYDHVNGTKVGGTIFDAGGNRHTAADLLRFARPDRITVLLHATAQRIIFRSREAYEQPTAYGVVFRDAVGTLHRAYLKDGDENEIIVAAGTLGSPQLLMLSGIGPAPHLQSFGIPVLVDQPMVGQGMADNPMNAIFIPSPRRVEFSLVQVVGITQHGTYIEGASGSAFGAAAGGGGRPRNFGMFSPGTGQISTVPPKERTPEAIERATEAMSRLDDRAFQGGFILEKVTGPLSSGHLHLRSRSPDDNPVVTFNYFSHPEDLRRCVTGIRVIESVVHSQAFRRFTYSTLTDEAMLNMSAHFPVNLLPRHPSDARSPEQYCRDTVMTIWHYHGGCVVGRVVDSNYRVLGVRRLRVIDSSTFNYSPGTNPQATVMMLGRYMGAKIVKERSSA